MSRLRKILLVLFFAMVAGGMAGAWLVWNGVRQLNPEDLRKLIVTAVKSDTGLDLVAGQVTTRISLPFRGHVRRRPLLDGNERVARFHPHYPGLRLSHPHLPSRTAIPVGRSGAAGAGPPGQFRAARTATGAGRGLGQRFETSPGAAVEYHPPTVRRFAPRSRIATAGYCSTMPRFAPPMVRLACAWQLDFNGILQGNGPAQLQNRRRVALAPEMDGPEVPFARGSFWFWDASLQDLATTDSISRAMCREISLFWSVTMAWSKARG